MPEIEDDVLSPASDADKTNQSAQKEPPKPDKLQPEKPPKQDSRLKLLFLLILRWTFAVLIVFGIGFIAAIFALYIPARSQVNQRTAELQQANQQISDLRQRIDSLSPLETNNQQLQTQADQANLHVAILSARLDVASAQLALAQDDPTRARVVLSKTPETLKMLESLLQPDQRKTAMDMQSRLDQAIGELEGNAFAATSDLGVLSNNLLELENAYFAKP